MIRSLLLALFVLAQQPATISYTDAKLLVQFPRGAAGACTIYWQHQLSEPDANFPDGHYAPKHCWWDFDPTTISYEDDWQWISADGGKWDVWAEIDYENGTTVKTNILTLVH